MDSVVIISYICLMIPITFMLFFIDSKSRRVYVYMMIGITMALIASQVNSIILNVAGNDYFRTTVNFTPISEEVLKSLPIFFFAFAVSSRREDVVSVGFAVGVGFALLENLTLMLQAGSSVDYLWIIFRCIGAGLMHSICTCMVGIGISFVRTRRKIFLTSTLSLLMFAVMFHSIFNTMVQVDSMKYFGIALPILAYIPMARFYFTDQHKKKVEKAE